MRPVICTHKVRPGWFFIHSILNFACIFFSLLFLTAKEFGCTEFVNPKDHEKPIQQVWEDWFLLFVKH